MVRIEGVVLDARRSATTGVRSKPVPDPESSGP
jgi:hypothetical protein